MKRHFPCFQALESRQLLAADSVPLAGSVILAEDAHALQAQPPIETSAQVDRVVAPAPDLVRFAKELTNSGAKFYGANWCPACTQQKQLFQDGGNELPFIDVTNPDRSANQFALDEQIATYPTWQFPDGTRAEGVLSLQELSSRSGIPIQFGTAPVFESIENQTVLNGSPLHLPIDAYDPNDSRLSFNVTIENPELIEAVILSGNQSIRIDMEHYGDMVFQLFQQRAPTATQRLIELAESSFYDGINFHRVIDNFVIQAGDPTGTGTMGSTLPDFDDDFHPDLQHNRSGVLSYAKARDDTNNSQFFVTEVPARHLDFNHSVFGQLVEGEDVREAISNHASNVAGKPTSDITISTVDVFDDHENAVLMLRGIGGQTGTTDVTVTVSDNSGGSYAQSFQVTVNDDAINSQPFLNPIDLPVYPAGRAATVRLTSTDVEGDAVSYSAIVLSNNAQASVDSNGTLTVVPESQFVTEVSVAVSVAPGPKVTGNASTDRDNQTLTFRFGETVIAPNIDLLSSSDSGQLSDDNVTNQITPTFLVDGAIPGASVELSVDGQIVGTAIALGTSVAVTTVLPTNDSAIGETLTVAAVQRYDGQVTSLGSLKITLDNSAPVLQRDTRDVVSPGTHNTIDLNSNEGTLPGVFFALVSSPDGATIDRHTGLIQWDAPNSLETDSVFIVSLTDWAGNVTIESFAVPLDPESLEPIVEIRLGLVDLVGQPIDTVQVGQPFRLQLIGVDTRPGLDQRGVYSIFTDVVFDGSLAAADSATQNELSFEFDIISGGVIGDGIIDEWGGASSATEASLEAASLISEAAFVATAVGELTFTADAAEGLGAEVLLYGINAKIPSRAIVFGQATLQIVAASEVVSGDVDRNGLVTPKDALMVINALSALPAGVMQVLDLQTAFAQRYDTNDDGWITPQDALMIINFLDRIPRSSVAAEATSSTLLGETRGSSSLAQREEALDKVFTDLFATEEPMLF